MTERFTSAMQIFASNMKNSDRRLLMRLTLIKNRAILLWFSGKGGEKGLL